MHLQAQGELQRTDRPLDLAVDGEGLLLVRDKSGTLGGARTGTFQVTKEGLIQNAQGLTLQGWPLLPEAAAAQTAKVAPPPSAAFAGSLGDLEDIQLIKPEVTSAKASIPYGTGPTIQKEVDGLYSFHSSTTHTDGFYESFTLQKNLVDSLGNKHTVEIDVWQCSDGTRTTLKSADLHQTAVCEYWADESRADLSFCTFDNATKQMTVTFPDTEAQLTLDISHLPSGGTHYSLPPSGGTLSWNFFPMIFEEGTCKISQVLESSPEIRWMVKRNEGGSFTGKLYNESYGFDVELYFDADGWVSGYQFTKNGGSTDDPSVGTEQTGSVVEGIHFVKSDTDYDTIHIDFSAFRIVNRTDSALVVNGATIKPEVSPGNAGSARTASGASLSEASSAMVSPSSLSIDENGVLKRLKDNGDWEPIYLLACGQFAAMNSAEERNGVYYATPASGALRTGISGKDGMGTITAGTLERSTTNLAHELSDMIRAQHAYAANTKVLSTLDDMLTELERL
jgi:flagellar hook-basal body protein